VQPLAVYYLRAVSFSYPLSGLVLVGSQAMYALARPMPAAVISLCRTIGIMVPFALIGQYFGQVHGVFIGIASAGATCGAIAWVTLAVVLAQEIRRHEAASSAAA
jgi:Na+-driven multidrug efflux pump